MIILHHQTYILVAVLRFVLCLWRRFFSYILCLLMRPLASCWRRQRRCGGKKVGTVGASSSVARRVLAVNVDVIYAKPVMF